MTEYKVEKVSHTTPARELEDRLNDLAKEEWALVGVDSRPDGRSTLYVFHREKKDGHKAVQGFSEAVPARSPKAENL